MKEGKIKERQTVRKNDRRKEKDEEEIERGDRKER
jgi:hypothetical protein